MTSPQPRPDAPEPAAAFGSRPPAATRGRPRREVEVLLRADMAAPIEALCSDAHRAGECRCGISTLPGRLGQGPQVLSAAQLREFEVCVGGAVDAASVRAYLRAAGPTMGPTEHAAFVSAALSLHQRLVAARSALGAGWYLGATSLRLPAERTVDVALPAAWVRSAQGRTDVGNVIGGGAHQAWAPDIAVEMTESEALEAWAVAVDDTLEMADAGIEATEFDDARAAWLTLERHPGIARWVESERVRLDVLAAAAGSGLAPPTTSGIGDGIRSAVVEQAVAAYAAEAWHEPEIWRRRYRARRIERERDAYLAARDLADGAGEDCEVTADALAVSAHGQWQAVRLRAGLPWPERVVLASPTTSSRRFVDGGLPDSELDRLRTADLGWVVQAAVDRDVARRAAGAGPAELSASHLAEGDVIAVTSHGGPSAATSDQASGTEWGLVSSIADSREGLRIITACGHVFNAGAAARFIAVQPDYLDHVHYFGTPAAAAYRDALSRTPGVDDDEGIAL